MDDLIFYFAVIVIAGGIFVPAHILAVRWMKGRRLITTLNGAIVLSGAVAAGVGWCLWAGRFSSPGAEAVILVGGPLTFAGFAALYCVLLPISVDRSVSAHIVNLIDLSPQRRLAEEELFRLYSHEDVLHKRFLDCVATGIIAREGGVLVLSGKGARIAWLYRVIGEALGMRLWFLERLRQGTKPF